MKYLYGNLLYDIITSYQKDKDKFKDFEKISNLCELFLIIIFYNKKKNYKITYYDIDNIRFINQIFLQIILLIFFLQ